ncbi:UdgX family uracil-DNA binding protein [Tahibacter amnicola]|uniref:Type-4 uracil-DNA glycosylase n=1 Tax=Tahibacter amnicola TaxID=2976241 RepID=A0ABY6BEV8_9GAMM|nr:UdgX family uracil-DNA binding protein [Tahibacter amnicola]UXI68569.1 UdgX family uracil-DNA binding protein [Tahibacter amnicola]
MGVESARYAPIFAFATIRKEAVMPDRTEPLTRRLPRKPAPSRTDPDSAIPDNVTLAQLREAAARCRACPLWRPATQTVFGEGPARARIMLIGEQPGDQEDRSGRPFVGPAGQLLDRALAEAGVARQAVYLTNAVKHFKFERRGKRRLHARANAAEQAACRRWLDAELRRLRPRQIVCLGAMAAQAVFGRAFRLLRERGAWRELPDGAMAFATVHPAYLLRLRDPAEREAAYAAFVRDLRLLRHA